MVLLYMVCHGSHQYSPFLLAYIPAPWIRHGISEGWTTGFPSSTSHREPRGWLCNSSGLVTSKFLGKAEMGSNWSNKKRRLFPTLTCGVFVFSSVSASRRLPHTHSPHTHTHSLTLTLTHSLSLTLTHSHSLSLNHSHSHSLSHSLTHSPTHSLTPHTLTHTLTHTHSHTLTHSHTHTHTHTHTHSHTHSLTHSLTLTHSHTHSLTHSLTHTLTHSHSLTHSHTHSHTHTHNVHCQGVGCTPWRPLGLRRFCVAGVGQCALPRGRMYALASLGSPLLLRGRRGTMCTAKGSDVRPGVPWVSAPFAWQAWHNVHCQGVGCTPWRPLGLHRFCVAGVAQCALPRGRMYALASLGSPLLLRGRRGTMCTAKGSDVRPGVPWVSAAFAWQAWHNVHCQGVGCTPWRPLGLRRFCVAGVAQCALPRGRMYALASLGSPPLLRGRRGTMCTAKGSDVRPGVPWVSASFGWQAWHNVHCQGVGCTPWRPLGLRPFCVAGVAQCRALPRGRMYALASLGSPPLLHGRRGTMCTAKGSDVRPGVPWVSASFAWQAWHNVHCQGVGCTPWRPLGLRLFCVTHSHSLTHPSLTQTTLTSPTHTTLTSLTHTLTHSPVHAHTYTHTHPPHHHPSITPHHSPTITPPPLLSFLFPSCFSMLSLSLEKLVTCGVIRSYNCYIYGYMYM